MRLEYDFVSSLLKNGEGSKREWQREARLIREPHSWRLKSRNEAKDYRHGGFVNRIQRFGERSGHFAEWITGSFARGAAEE